MLSVQTDLLKAMARLRSMTEAQQLRFATAKALTQTAYEAQAEVKKNMPSRFTLRRNWIVQGIRVEKATKQALTATVYSRDKFMGLQEYGGAKNPLRRYLAVPTKAVKRTKTDIIRKADRPAALGDKAEIVTVKGNKFLALKKGRKGASKNQLRLLYLLIPRANLKQRLGLNKDGQRIARQRFVVNLQRALADAVRTAR
jgi:hypothetical protein